MLLLVSVGPLKQTNAQFIKEKAANAKTVCWLSLKALVACRQNCRLGSVVFVRVASLLTKFVRSYVVNTAQFIAHNRRSCLLMGKMMSMKTGVCMFAM